MPIVLYCRARYASAPCWIAFEIFCISGVPRLRESTHRARKIAKTSARALAPITTDNRLDCVGVMLRGRWNSGEGHRITQQSVATYRESCRSSLPYMKKKPESVAG